MSLVFKKRDEICYSCAREANDLMMKNIALLFFIVSVAPCAGQPKSRNVKQEITWLRNSLVQHHVAPKTIDDSFSSDLFDKVVADLDPHKVFFTQEDIHWLEPFRHLLDDEINGKSTGFLPRVEERYRSGLMRSERFINLILEAPIDWKKQETYDPDPQWVKDEQALAERHRQWLKYEILDRLSAMLDRDTVLKPDFFDRNIKAALVYVQRSTLQPITRLLQPDVLKNEIATAFMEAMAGVFDPHSTFFSAHDYDDFVGSLSTEDYYFGFTLDENANGNIVISALAPGGAAWKSGDLHVSDVLLAIKLAQEDPVDLRGMNLDDINEMLDANDSDILEMTVRTVDGNEKNVMLRKEKLTSEADIVQSFILDGDMRVGYIYLPDFYTRWGDDGEGGRCANDVAKEIIKLKREGIEGIILDLRFNGGGSLYEARAMSGIFIDEGPLAMVSTRDQKPVTLKDMNRGTVYDGPLVIMVNGNSASASEVLAGAIQDYNRGLIVGSQTYGKATGQNLFPLEGLAAGTSPEKAGQSTAGYVKVTTQKLYRVTGKSAQGTGVTPDLLMPDIFTSLNTHESQTPFALPKDSIGKNSYYKPLTAPDRTALQARSGKRIAESPAFRELQKGLALLQEDMLKTSEPQQLVWTQFLKETIQARTHDKVKDLQASASGTLYKVSNSAAKDERLAVDDYARAMNERWLEIITTDIYLQETYNILLDHITFTKKPSR
jgi:carboxyl-terminal processing protease